MILVYAAYTRCRCGAGLAYNKGGNLLAWVCSAVLLGDTEGEHDPSYPFAFYEVKSENQPSARGATTRPLDPTRRGVTLCKHDVNEMLCLDCVNGTEPPEAG